MYPAWGICRAEDSACRADLLDHFEHIKSLGYKATDALAQLVREIAFTHLNRLCAYKMMEAREVWVGGQKFREAVSRGLKSQGFSFYLAQHPEDEKLHNTGHQDIAYRHFLDWLGGTLSEEIGVLFSPTDPANRLYPPQRVLEDVIDLLNGSDIKPEDTDLREQWPQIWSQDETIGWVYQYFTPKELRDQVRKESAAPRNSYELAFRNQFFTPRYVVEFLTDNTLGRIWYEMRNGDTKLKDQCHYMVRRPNEVFLAQGQETPKDTATENDLSQGELLKQPVFIPHRPKKDPRELKIMDLACGSAHFLLYGFDLLETIYEEAYNDPELGKVLKKDYPTIEALRKDVPRLILAHNLYGIDIDKRATQIAALALWLRCQRAYKELGLTKDRPKIIRSNMVCAEPMPGEKEMLKEFTAELQPKLLGHFVEVVFEKMKLAGEAGSLLTIEEELREEIASVRRQWVQEQERAVDKKGRAMLFSRAEMDRSKKGQHQPQLFDVLEITEEQFWNEAESRVLESLQDYAAHATHGGRLRRQLFAEDAGHGFAFIDVCQKRFDVVLMNPPFGLPPEKVSRLLKDMSPAAHVDLYPAFLLRAGQFAPNGRIGVISSRSFLMTPRLTSLREQFLVDRIAVLLDLGPQVMDEAEVESCAYVLSGTPADVTNDILALNLRFAEAKHALLARRDESCSGDFKKVNRAMLRSLPGCRLLYSLPPHLCKLLKSEEVFEPMVGTARCGGRTFDDFRFLRAHWEASPSDIGRNRIWVPFCKGGEYSPYYGDIHLVIKWENDGKEVGQKNIEVNGQTAQAWQASSYYFRKGATYSRRSKAFGVRVMPEGCIFGEKGPAVLSESAVPPEYLIGWLNSRLIRFLIELQANKYQFDTGIIKRLPWRLPKGIEDVGKYAATARKLIELARNGYNLIETAPCFTISLGGLSLFALSSRLEAERGRVLQESQELASCWDEFVEQLYGVAAEEIKEAISGDNSDDDAESDSEETDTEGIFQVSIETAQVTRVVMSVAFGTVFGRWDIRKMLRASDVPELPDIFIAIPPCSPVMLQNAHGLPASEEPLGYPIRIDWAGILPDDTDHSDDIVRRVREVLELVWKDRAESIEGEACEILGVKQLRDYFRKPGKGGFWDDHVRRYSKSRRKAPIYWLLQSSKKNYALWLYYHRLDKDILFKALVNYVEPKIRLEENRLAAMRGQKGPHGESGKGAKKIDKDMERQEDFLSDLRDFEEKLRRAANLHLEPDLNDGVVLNIAPLWELVPWKDAKAYWEELLQGEYEWSSIGKQLKEKGLVK